MIADVAIGIGKTIKLSRAAVIPLTDQISRIRGTSVVRRLMDGAPPKTGRIEKPACHTVYISAPNMRLKPISNRARNHLFKALSAALLGVSWTGLMASYSVDLSKTLRLLG